MALGITLENIGFFLKSNLPVWPENCWIKYLAQVFPEPGADAIAVRGPEDFCEKKYVSTFVRFLSYSPNPTTQFRNHEFWIFIKYWTNKIVWVKKPAYTWKTFVKFLCENSDLKFQNWWLDLMSKNAKSRDNFSGSVWNFPGGSKILNGPLHHFSDFSSCFLAE